MLLIACAVLVAVAYAQPPPPTPGSVRSGFDSSSRFGTPPPPLPPSFPGSRPPQHSPFSLPSSYSNTPSTRYRPNTDGSFGARHGGPRGGDTWWSFGDDLPCEHIFESFQGPLFAPIGCIIDLQIRCWPECTVAEALEDEVLPSSLRKDLLSIPSHGETIKTAFYEAIDGFAEQNNLTDRARNWKLKAASKQSLIRSNVTQFINELGTYYKNLTAIADDNSISYAEEARGIHDALRNFQSRVKTLTENIFFGILNYPSPVHPSTPSPTPPPPPHNLNEYTDEPREPLGGPHGGPRQHSLGPFGLPHGGPNGGSCEATSGPFQGPLGAPIGCIIDYQMHLSAVSFLGADFFNELPVESQLDFVHIVIDRNSTKAEIYEAVASWAERNNVTDQVRDATFMLAYNESLIRSSVTGFITELGKYYKNLNAIVDDNSISFVEEACQIGDAQRNFESRVKPLTARIIRVFDLPPFVYPPTPTTPIPEYLRNRTG